ncbi:MAG: phytanoyl-CoA dioxygenase family protein [Kangiellaceae bacterium]|nr:phytanoyl-CoA dioxygenase family protein [Kangiellaceae bacterium]MCW9015496.1 phytanoyl-CoA dioxygenase family protein [Kangiellaceae bacterium]
MSFQQKGFELVDDFIDWKTANSIIEEVEPFLKNIKGGGIRNADKKFSNISQLAYSDDLLNQASRYLSSKPNFVRAILFDKSHKNNWLVTWHQDKTIAVSDKFEAEGWGPWSFKDGVHHVQPPIEVLNNMVTFRIHLDESNLENGCLKVIPESHLVGLLSQDEIQRYIEVNQSITVSAPILSALVMKPHILHASCKAAKPSRRRILHLEYCGGRSLDL